MASQAVMLPEIELEALRYFDRDELEGLQIHSRYLHGLVSRHARTLSLRCIHEVWIGCNNVRIRLLKTGKAVRGKQAREELFDRVNNAFVDRLVLSFRRENLSVLHSLRARVEDLQCQIRVLRVTDVVEADGNKVALDRALIDFLGVHLKPQLYEASTNEEGHAMLFAQNALRGVVSHLVYELDEEPAPDCIIPELFGVNVVESCAIMTEVDPSPWIRKFIEKFETAERGTNIIRAVTLAYRRDGKAWSLGHAVGRLGQPPRTDVSTPHNAFVKKWFRCIDGFTITESPVAELYVFENAKAAKKLEVFVWTVEEVYRDSDISLHYAFLFQVVDM